MARTETVILLTLTILLALNINRLPITLGAGIDTSQEYQSGDLQLAPWLQAWYTWVNYQGVQTIFLALHSSQYQSPVFSFIGQAYNTTAGSRIFVGSLLLLMELYNDTNRNGVLDANYTSGISELKYSLMMNASQTFDATPVTKNIESNVTHYKWGIRYGGLQGILGFLTEQNCCGAASSVLIDHLAVTYDYSMAQNTTSLKTSIDMGNMSLIPPVFVSNTTINGLSLDLLYSTVVVSPKHYQIISGDNTINSTQNNPALPLDAAQLNVGSNLAYKFLFGGNYTLYREAPSTYPAKTAAVSRDSVPLSLFSASWFSSLRGVEYYVGNSLPVIGDLPAESNLSYNSSSFLYRVSYPQWSGYGLRHDPTYVAYFIPTSILPALPVLTLVFVAVAGIAALVIAARRIPRVRKIHATQARTVFNTFACCLEV